MLAAYHGRADVVRLLLSHGADPNRVNDRGQTPLAGAIFKNEVEVADALLEGGADPLWGAPSSLETATIFKKLDIWSDKFASARGAGTGGINSAPLVPETA
jgi:ankyrin repeat protein